VGVQVAQTSHCASECLFLHLKRYYRSRERWLVEGPAGEVNRRLGLTVAGEVDRVSLKGLSGGRRSAGDSRVSCSEGFSSSNGSISAAFDVQRRAKVLLLSCSKENMTLKRTVFAGIRNSSSCLHWVGKLAIRASRRRLAFVGDLTAAIPMFLKYSVYAFCLLPNITILQSVISSARLGDRLPAKILAE
jgi:hypothetical protein